MRTVSSMFGTALLCVSCGAPGSKAEAPASGAPKPASSARTPEDGPHCGDRQFPLVKEKASHPTRGKRARTQPGATPDVPPPGMFQLVKYPSSVGPLHAYVTPDPGDGRRRPAVVWAHGGFDWSIDATFFEAGPAEDDQSAAAFREAGVVLMLPSFRGANDNPGAYEELFGEVDDFVCAAAYTASLPYVDPNRLYLAGHSTGGTLVLLAAASTDKFHMAIAFGPVADPRGYGMEYSPFSVAAEATDREWDLRSPIRWIGTVKRPTLIFEGEDGNIEEAAKLEEEANRHQAPVIVRAIEGADHFSILRPLSESLAQTMLRQSKNEP